MRLDALVKLALDEDIGPGDRTTEATIGPEVSGVGRMLAKQDLVMCGHDAARAVFAEVDARYGGTTAYEVEVADGSDVSDRTYVASVRGPLRNIVIGERCALNFVMRMSGIATNTAEFVRAAGESTIRIVDTRKTTPLHRALEKYAVRCGGGHNHRHALYDGVMVKDNHITAVGSLKNAVAAARAHNHHLIRIEVEASTLAEVEEALETDADVIMLDNMDNEEMRAAIARIRATRPVVIEASGNITPERVASMTDLDLDVVSSGGLIHQARWADLSLKLQ